MRTIIETLPSRPAGNPKADTPLRKWIAFAVELTGRVTDFGIFGGMAPMGPWSITAFGGRSPCGSTRANGTPSTTFGPQSSKTRRTLLPGPDFDTIPFVVV